MSITDSFRRGVKSSIDPFGLSDRLFGGPDLSATDAQRATNMELEQQIRTQNAENQANILAAEAGITRIETDDGVIEVGPSGANLIGSEVVDPGQPAATRSIAEIIGRETGVITPEIDPSTIVTRRTTTPLDPGAVSPDVPNAVTESLKRRRQSTNGRFGRGATVLTSPIGLSSDTYQRRRLLG